MKKSFAVRLNAETKKAYFTDPNTAAGAKDSWPAFLPVQLRADGSKFIDCPGAGRWDLGAEDGVSKEK